MRLDFHGKVYSVPPAGIAVGSANATLSGLGLGDRFNQEVATIVERSTHNEALVQGLFLGATRVDAVLLHKLARAVQNATRASSVDWPDSVLNLLTPPVGRSHLLVDECFWSHGQWLRERRCPSTAAEMHDMALLQLQPRATLATAGTLLE